MGLPATDPPCWRCRLVDRAGTGEDVRIWELANIISDVVGFSGEILWDFTKPNGTPRKVLNVDKIKSLDWQPKIGLCEGIEKTYKWYKENG